MTRTRHLLQAAILLILALALAACQSETSSNNNNKLPGSPANSNNSNSTNSDKCANVTCNRGECEKTTGKCVDKLTCTQATEATDCLATSRCIGRKCIPINKICGSIICRRGVCDSSLGKCVSATSCGTDDSKCAFGDYCLNGSCVDNKCETPPDRVADCSSSGGICNPATGQCDEPAVCTAPSDCRKGRNCANGKCEPAGYECGVCSGTMKCHYDPTALTAECVEDPTGCGTSFDCREGHVCSAPQPGEEKGRCKDAGNCSPDSHEPFNSSNPIDVTGAAGLSADGWLEDLNLCSNDEDAFTFDTSQTSVSQGALLVELELTEGLGNGPITLSIFDSFKNKPVAEKVFKASEQTAGNNHYTITYEIPLSAPAQPYTIRVKAGELRGTDLYRIKVNLIQRDAPAICNAAQTIPTDGSKVSGALTATSLTGLKGTCGGDLKSHAEAWSFSLGRESYVQIEAKRDGYSLGYTLSLRGDCLSDRSELNCSENSYSSTSSFNKILPAGTYFVIVTGKTPSDTGNYKLSVTATPTQCAAGEIVCDDTNTILKTCNANRTDYDTETCPNGCSPTKKACIEQDGETCAYAKVVNAVPYTDTVNLGNFKNMYQPDGCPGAPSFSGAAPDVLYNVTVPQDEALRVHVESTVNNERVQLYLLDQCPGAKTCKAFVIPPASATNADLFWMNDTGAEKSLIVVLDADYSAVTRGDHTITIDYGTPLCTPNAYKCDPSTKKAGKQASYKCDALGKAWVEDAVCSDLCGNELAGECDKPKNDTCDQAILLENGVPVEGDLSTMTHTVDHPPKTCFDKGSATRDGNDAFFWVDVPANKNVTLSLSKETGSGSWDPYIWVTNAGCVGKGASAQAGQCSQATDSFHDDTPEILQFHATTAQKYLVVVSQDSYNQPGGKFTLTANIESACTPGELLGCTNGNNSMSFCDSNSFVQSKSCATGCNTTTKRCNDNEGKICADYIALSGNGGSEVGTYDSSQKNSIDLPPGSSDGGTFGGCYFDSSSSDQPSGYDTIYAVQLAANQLFHAELVTDNSYAMLYLLKNCGDINTCEGKHQYQAKSVDYLSKNGEFIYVVVDSGSTSSSSKTFTLNWNVTDNAQCLPYGSTCDGNDIKQCDSTGMNFTTHTCPSACTNGLCDGDGSETCSTALNLGTGATVNYHVPNNFKDPRPACAYSPTSTHRYYSIDVNAGDYVTVTARPPYSEHVIGSFGLTTDPLVFLFDDCSMIEKSCLKGGTRENVTYDEPYRFTYKAENTGKLYLALGSRQSASTGDDYNIIYTVDVSSSPQCNDSDPALCLGGTRVQYCSGGYHQVVTCSGAGGCVAGKCQTATGDNCFDAIPLNPNNESASTSPLSVQWEKSGTNPAATDRVHLGVKPLGKVQACLFDSNHDTIGRDRVYSVTLNAGETFTATITSRESDLIIYLTDSCTSNSTCLDRGVRQFSGGYSFDSTYKLAYKATKTGTYYFVIDSDDKTESFTTSFEWKIDSTLTCAPNRTTCSLDNIVQCNDDGTSEVVESCAGYSCSYGYCDVDSTTLSSCSPSSTPFEGSFSLYVDPTSLAKKYNTKLSCFTGGSDTNFKGPESFIHFKLKSQEGVTVSIVPADLRNSSYMVAILDDCTFNGASCKTGKRFNNFSYSSPPSLSFQNTSSTAKDYYLYIDQDLPSLGQTTLPYIVNVTYQ